MSQEPDTIQVLIDTPVPAILMLQPEWGPPRPATVDDLYRMGYRSRTWLYDRTIEMFEAAGMDPHDNGKGSLLRYFIEYITQYDWPMNVDDLKQFRTAFQGTDDFL